MRAMVLTNQSKIKRNGTLLIQSGTRDYIDLYMCVFPNYTASTAECFPALAVEYFPELSTSVF